LIAENFELWSKGKNPISHTTLKRLIAHFSKHGDSERKSRSNSILDQLSDPNEKYRKIECSHCGKLLARNHFKRHVCISMEAA
jgi:hypothetical protein